MNPYPLKLANPLHYPLATLAGGLVLFGGVRLAQLPSAGVLPVAAAIAALSAAALQARQPTAPTLDNPQLAQLLRQNQQQALQLTQQAEALRSEAHRLLTHPHQLELLGVVQYACDRSRELPDKLDQLTQRLQGSASLLSVTELQKQLAAAEQRQPQSSGAASNQWAQLAASLRRNIELAQQGRDAREAQVVSLSTLILEAAGGLQQLQNKLRTADLDNSQTADEVRDLSQTVSRLQETIEVLMLEELP